VTRRVVHGGTNIHDPEPQSVQREWLAGVREGGDGGEGAGQELAARTLTVGD
jgi:hypothetical protein